ncbi:hypothetical protein STVA_41970 [Allostella vacuolata]|nr:hypothetical protein STVA_41970 [Stella vacuolata]
MKPAPQPGSPRPADDRAPPPASRSEILRKRGGALPESTTAESATADPTTADTPHLPRDQGA